MTRGRAEDAVADETRRGRRIEENATENQEKQEEQQEKSLPFISIM